MRWFVIALLVVGLMAVFSGWQWTRRAVPDVRSIDSVEQATPIQLDREAEAQVVAFCGDCHGLPHPDNYSRDAWRKEVIRGYEFYARSGRRDLDPPPVHHAIAYYQARAPSQPTFTEPQQATRPLSVRFSVQKLAAGRSVHFPPSVAHLRWTELEAGGPSVLLAADMRQGTVTALDLAGDNLEPQLLAQLHHPCHVEPCDLDGDQRIDLVVADLGGLAAVDYDLGRVVWLRRRTSARHFEPIVIAAGLGRVSDVRPADLDGDGDLDLVVAEFGARRGRILLLRNVTAEGEEVRFQTKELDTRPGAIHLPIHDLDHDGRADVVALVSQEFETVDALMNEGDGQFRLVPLWTAADPAFGSSGIQLVDMDQDGDLDILHSSGDSFDDKYVKPCHGVQWLENQGDLSFAYHRLTDLPGTYRALAGDIDLDGDVDVVATVWIEPKVRFGNPAVKQWASLVCLEQVAPGEFARHTLESDFPWHAAMEMADFDGDGDLDFALGSHSRNPTMQLPYWLAIWWNQGIP